MLCTKHVQENNQNLDKSQQVKTIAGLQCKIWMQFEFEHQPTPNSPQARLMSCTGIDAKQSHTEKKQQYNNGKGSSSSLNHRAIRHIVLQHLPNLFLTGQCPKCLTIFLVLCRYQFQVGNVYIFSHELYVPFGFFLNLSTSFDLKWC